MAAASTTNTLRWLSLVAVIWLQSINGTNTNFPSYSSELKRILSFSQLQLNNLAFASDAGKLFGFIAGIATIYFPLWVVLFIGTILGLLGYGLQYVFLTHTTLISSLNYWHVFLLTLLAGNSICWINTVCYVVTVRNFSFHLQAAAGLSTSYVGLSAMIYTAVVNALFGKTQGSVASRSAPAYLLLNAIVPLAVSVITAPFIGTTTAAATSSSGYNGIKAPAMRVGFILMTVITVCTGIYAVVISSLSYRNSSGKLPLPALMNLIGIVMFLALPIAVPLGEFLRGSVMETTSTKINTDQTMVCDENCLTTTASTECGTTTTNDDDDHHHHNKDAPTKSNHDNNDDHVVKVHVMEEIGAKQMLMRLNFWVYFLVYLLGATIGLVYLNNLGQIAESRGWHDASSLVSMSSAFGFCGRLLPCLFHYIWSRWSRIVPGPACIVGIMIPLSGAFFLLLLDGSRLSLCISTGVIGVCTGAITTIAVSVTTELFGTQNFGVNHNLVVANIPIGSILFGDVAAFQYKSVAATEDKVAGSSSCLGLNCYRDTFLIWGSLSFVGTLLAFILYFRTRKFYSH